MHGYLTGDRHVREALDRRDITLLSGEIWLDPQSLDLAVGIEVVVLSYSLYLPDRGIHAMASVMEAVDEGVLGISGGGSDCRPLRLRVRSCSRS